MKNLIIALILGSALPAMNANATANNPDQAESDAAYALFETYTVKASAADVDGLPAKFKCGALTWRGILVNAGAANGRCRLAVARRRARRRQKGRPGLPKRSR